jgi:hypothetical protein
MLKAEHGHAQLWLHGFAIRLVGFWRMLSHGSAVEDKRVFGQTCQLHPVNGTQRRIVAGK